MLNMNLQLLASKKGVGSSIDMINRQMYYIRILRMMKCISKVTWQ